MLAIPGLLLLFDPIKGIWDTHGCDTLRRMYEIQKDGQMQTRYRYDIFGKEKKNIHFYRGF